LWRSFLVQTDTRHKLKPKQLRDAMRLCLGCVESDGAIDLAFSEIDDDRMGVIIFDQFDRWINGQAGRRSVARALRLSNRADGDVPLESVQWTRSLLRDEVQRALSRARLNGLDLVMAYDSSADGTLQRKEYLVMMKAMLGDDEVWAEQFKPVAVQV